MRILVVFAFMLMSCNPKAQDSVKKSQEDLKTEFSLPKKLKEVSGIALSQDQKTIWAIEDAGNKNVVYGLNRQGELVTDVLVENVENNDWEDIAKDAAGNIYIGDFGNNENDRQNLSILKLDLKMILRNRQRLFRPQNSIMKDRLNFLPKSLIYCTIAKPL